MYSDKSKIQRKAAEESLKLQDRKKEIICYLSNMLTFPLLYGLTTSTVFPDSLEESLISH